MIRLYEIKAEEIDLSKSDELNLTTESKEILESFFK